jgi:hypothetical protein
MGVIRNNSATLKQRGPRSCTRGEARSGRGEPRCELIGRNDVYGAAAALERPEQDRECLVPGNSVVCLGCNAATRSIRVSRRCSSVSGMIQSRHSRRSVPIIFSHNELAFGLRIGVLMTARPRPATEASRSVEKIASRSWMIKRYAWSEGMASRNCCRVHAAVGWAVTLA